MHASISVFYNTEEVCSSTADADFYFPNTPLNILCDRNDFAEMEWGRGNSAALCRMVAHLLEVECTESSLEENGAVGRLLRDNVYVTYHVISALFDDLFKKQRDFPNGYVPFYYKFLNNYTPVYNFLVLFLLHLTTSSHSYFPPPPLSYSFSLLLFHSSIHPSIHLSLILTLTECFPSTPLTVRV